MIVKFIYNKIYINNDIEPVYIANAGIVVDKITGKNIYKLFFKECKPFFYFKLEFNDYKYIDYYNSKTQNYNLRAQEREYNLILCVNLTQLNANKYSHNTIFNKLSYFLLDLQLRDLKTTKDYKTNSHDIKKFIDYRELNPMYLINWKYYRLNSTYVYNLESSRILCSQQIKKVNFKRFGGIIETNNVKKLLHDNFANTNNFVIIPTNMCNLWDGNANKILTYDDLVTINKSNIHDITNGVWDKIIIHECHLHFLVGIKKLLRYINCSTVWIINSLPLKYYMMKSDTSFQITASSIFTISNLWIGFDSIDQKKIYKTELMRLFFTKFNQYYTQIEYTPSLTRAHIQLKLSDFESNVANIFLNYLYNWCNKLSNDSNNIYSTATREFIDTLKSKILDSVLLLSTVVIDENCISNYFAKKISEHLGALNDLLITMENLFKTYTTINCTFKNITNNNLSHVIDKISTNKNTINLKISNFTNINKNLYTKANDMCSICYSSVCNPQAILLCGHSFCLECVLHSITNKNECPLCREYITVDKIAIVKNTIPNYTSNILKYISNVNVDTIIFTNIDSLVTNNQIININKSFYSELSNIKRAQQIIFVLNSYTSAKSNIMNNVVKLTNYFDLFNANPVLTYATIDF